MITIDLKYFERTLIHANGIQVKITSPILRTAENNYTLIGYEMRNKQKKDICSTLTESEFNRLICLTKAHKTTREGN